MAVVSGSFGLGAVPRLPLHHVPRHASLAAIERLLLDGDARGVVGITGAGTRTGTFGIHGMGGIGKSVLAAAVARSPAVRERFGDGVLWLAVGQTPHVPTLQAQLARELGHREVFDTPAQGKRRLEELFAERAVLLILDDVWAAEHAASFDVVGDRGKLLITTRNRLVLSSLGAIEHRLDVLAPDQAHALLAEWAGTAASLDLAARVADACGHLPLALAMVGAMVRAEVVGWSDALELLTRADLAEIEAEFPEYPYPSVLATIEVSVAALDPDTRRRYLDLAVFAEDEAIPEPALEVLWGLDRARARKLAGTLEARSLSLRDEAGRVHLHDLQRLYVRGRAGDLAALHGRLVDAYESRCGHGLATGLDDGYFFQKLPSHLAAAGRAAELRALLGSYEWLGAKLRATSPAEIIADFALIGREHRDDELVLVRDALRLSSHVLARNSKDLPGQLIGRLGYFEDEGASVIRALLAQARGESRYAWLMPVTPSLTPPGGPLVRTLAGHANAVNTVAVTPDGLRAVSGSRDRTLMVWDLARGTEIRALPGHSAGVTLVALTPDGARAVSASYDGQLGVWDIERGESLHMLAAHARGIRALAVLPDGARAITASKDRTLTIWDIVHGTCLAVLVGHRAVIEAVAMAPDGTRAVSASLDKTLKVWDLTAGTERCTLAGHRDGVTAVAITPDGKRALSASLDGTLKLWDLDQGSEIATFAGHETGVQAVALIGGKRAVSASYDGVLKVWDLGLARELCTLRGHRNEVFALAVTPDGSRVISASKDRTLRVWDPVRGVELCALAGHSDWVMAVAVMPDGAGAISASADGTLRVWNLDRGRTARTIAAHATRVTDVCILPDGARAVSASRDGTLTIWDVDRGASLYTLAGHRSGVAAVAVTPDGTRAVSASRDMTLQVWDLGARRAIRTLRGHRAGVVAVAILPGGTRVISGAGDGELKIWELDTGVEVCTMTGHLDVITGLAVLPDGKRVLSASWDKTLRIWDLERGVELRTLAHHTSNLCFVTVMPDGKRAVTVALDRTMTTWDLDTGAALFTLAGNFMWSTVVATADGDRAVSVSEDAMLSIRDPETGIILATFATDSVITAFAYSASRNRLIAGDQAGCVHFLDIGPPFRALYAPPAPPASLAEGAQDSDSRADIGHADSVAVRPEPRRVFVSYSHDSAGHAEQVRALADRLRREGLDAWIDQYEPHPAEGWPRWMRAQLERAEVILVVCTPTYRRRFDGEEEPGRGKGVAWEGMLTAQMLYEAQGKNRRIIPVLFDGDGEDAIPLALQPYTHYRLPAAYDALYRRLTNQPDIVPPTIGPLRTLRPRGR